MAATDEDDDYLTYALSGSDAFTIDGSGQLAVASGADLDYETQASYTVTVTVHDGKNAAGETDTGVDDSIAVTISVVNVDEAGQVLLNTMEPSVGSALGARVFDPDGGVTGDIWTWESSADGTAWTAIAGAADAAYTPVDGDAGRYLRAGASYADAQGAGKSARSDAAGPVTGVSRQLSANAAPQFAADTATRSVDENTPGGTSVGDPITATDSDDDTLTYALSGSDAGVFDFETDTGQIKVKDALDYETTASYTVTVTVSDGKNAQGEADTSVDDSIAVTITVVNVDEPGVVSLNPDTPQVGAELTATVLDPDGGVTGLTWAWERSADGNAWTAIAGAAGAAYTPADLDVGNYLRAIASYADGHGPGKTAQAQAANPAQAAAPTITGNPILNSPAAGGVYGSGEQVIVQLTFSAPVTVSGQPRLGLVIGDAARWATYSQSSQDGATQVFTYAVQAGDKDDDGLSVTANSLELNGGSITGANGIATDLAHPGVTNLPTHRVDGSGLSSAQPQLSAPTAQAVTSDWPLIPSGVNVGDSFRLLFVTSTRRNAVPTGIADYNAFVQAAANNNANLQPFKGQFRVVGSTATVDARDNTATTGTGVPIYWVGGTRVANDYADFYDNSWESGPPKDESGNNHITDTVFTGTKSDGTKSSLPLGSGSVTLGDATGTTGSRLAKNSPGSRQGARFFYGLSPVITVVDPPNFVPANWPLKPADVGPGDSFRLLFISLSGRNADSTDIADYNTFVQTQANNNENLRPFKDQFRVVGSTATVDARDNTATTGAGVPIYWVGGARVANDYGDFYDGTWHSYTVKTESGNDRGPSTTFTGTKNDGTKSSRPLGNSTVSFATPHLTGAGRNTLDANRYAGNTASLPFYALSPVLTVEDKFVPVPGDWPLKPSGLRAGDRFRLLFVTSTTHQAQATDIDHYNGLVQTAAAANTNLARYGSQFRVLASTEAVDARDNTETTGTGVPIYWVGGDKVANGYASDFYGDDIWASHAARDQSGATITFASDTHIWTGSDNDGTDDDGYWLGANAPALGEVASGKVLNRGTSDANTNRHHLYALSPVFAVSGTVVTSGWEYTPAGVDPGGSFRLLFVGSSEHSAASSNITDYNNVIRGLANNNTVLRPYKDGFSMVGSTQAVDARDNTATRYTGDTTSTATDDYNLGVPIYWVGGAKVADDYRDFWDGSWDSQAGTTEAGSAHPNPGGGARMWTGSESNGVEDDGNWLGAQHPIAGEMTSGKEVKSHHFANNEMTNRHFYGLSSVLTRPVPLPAKPANLGATAGADEVALRWDDPSDSTITGYQYRQRAGTGDYGEWTDIPNSGAATVSHTVTGLTPGAEYTFQVRAVNVVGNSPESDAVIAMPTSAMPKSGLTVPVGWAHIPKDSSNDPLVALGGSFRLLFVTSTQVSVTSSDIATYNNHAQTEANTNLTLQPFGGQFRAVVSTQTVDARDNTATRFTGDATASASDDSDLGVPIYWVNGARVADEYRDFYDGTWDSRAAKFPSGEDSSGVGGVATGSNDDGTKHTSYYAGSTSHVQAGDFSGSRSLLSHTASPISVVPTGYIYALSPVITVAAATVSNSVPAAPANLTAAAGVQEVTLSWSNPGDSTITGYQYQQKEGTGNYGNWTDIPNSGAATVSHTVTGLMAGTEYAFRVRAVNAVGNSAASGVAKAKPPATAPPVAPEQSRVDLATENNGLRVVRTELRESGGNRSLVQVKATAALSQTNDTVVTMTVTPVAPAGEEDYRLHAGTTQLTVPAGSTESSNWLIIYPVDNDEKGPPFKELSISGAAGSTTFGPVKVRIWDEDAEGRPGYPEEVEVPSDSALIPKDSMGNPLVGQGERFRLLFVTSTTTPAQSWNIEDYNKFVQDTAAGAAGTNAALAGALQEISGGFRAVVSTLTEDAYDNTWTDEVARARTGDVPIYWAGGEQVADGYIGYWGDDAPDGYAGFWATIYSNVRSVSWSSVKAKTESGADYTGQFFTGSTATGQTDIGYYAGGDRVRVGAFPGVNGHVWGSLESVVDAQSGTGESVMATSLPLLAISPVIQVEAPATVRLRMAPSFIGERGGRTIVRAEQDRPLPGVTTLEVEVLSEGGDLELPQSMALTIPAGETKSGDSLIITARDNAMDSEDKQVTLVVKKGTLVNAHAGALGWRPATLTITDDDATPTLTLTLENGGRISENGGQARATLDLSHPSSQAVTVTLSAPGSPHYNLAATRITIPAGATSASAAFLTAVDNNVYGPSQREVAVAVSVSGGNGVAAPEPVTVVITDDDPAPRFRLAAAPVDEGGTARVHGVLLDRSLHRQEMEAVFLKLRVEPVSVHATGGDLSFRDDTLSLSAGSSVDGDGRFDYGELRAAQNSRDEIDKRFTVSATFVDANGNPITDKARLRELGANPMPVTLTVRDDDCCAPPELTLTLISGTDRYGIATIPNDGGTAQVTVELNTPSASDATVRITVYEIGEERVPDGNGSYRYREKLFPSNLATVSNGGVVTIPAEQLRDPGPTGTLTITARNMFLGSSRLPLRVVAEVTGGDTTIVKHSGVLVLTE